MPIVPRRDEVAFKEVLKAIEAGFIEPYRNVLNEPYVCCKHPAYPARNLRLSEPDFRHWLVYFIRCEAGILLHDQEVRRIVAELSGRSMANRIGRVGDEALTHLLESEPVVAVTYEFMFQHSKNPYEQKGEVLWEELRAFASQRQLLSIGRRQFPGGPQVLSRLLKKHADALHHLCIHASIKRSNGCIITLRRVDASPPQASCEASDTKSAQEQNLLHKDGIQARVRRLEAKKHQQPKK